MDMRKCSGSSFLKLDDVREGPIKVTIADISEGKYDKPDVTFDDGTKLSINATNNRVLVREFGHDSDDWIGKEIELTLGEIEYQGKMQASIIIKPISPAVTKKVAPKSDMDDDIPSEGGES